MPHGMPTKPCAEVERGSQASAPLGTSVLIDANALQLTSTDYAASLERYCAGNGSMNYLLVLIPLAILMGFVGLVAFLWSLRSGQYEDLEGAAERIFLDDDDRP